MAERLQSHTLTQQYAAGATRDARTRAAALAENLAIAGGYVLLAWVGDKLRLDRRVILFWPAAGYSLAVLLVRGNSRWPGVLLGSLLSGWSGLMPTGPTGAAPPNFAFALLTGTARALSTLAGAWLVVRVTGTRRWPRSVQGVLVFALLAGIVYPAMAALATQAAGWPGRVGSGALAFPRELWLWFVANSTGSLVVAPLVLALRERPAGRPDRSHREIALTAMGFVLAGAMCLGFTRERATPIPLAYPLAPLMLWATLRFGARGAALSNTLWAVVLVGGALSAPAPEGGFGQIFTELHARLAVLATVVLGFAAAFEERLQLQSDLESERRGLEARVAERTGELARYLSLLHSSLESTADGLLVVDREGRIIATNHRFKELWRIPGDILESGDDQRALDYVRDQLASPASFTARVEYLYAHPELESEDEVLLMDGRVFERFSRPQRMGEAIVGRVWSFRDVTLRRLAEAERSRLLVEESRARQDAERALHLREDFLQVAAHEMKTPVTAMKMQLQQLVRLASGPGPDPARLLSLAAAALRPMRRFEELTAQLLDVSQLEQGQLPARIEPLDFREVVQEQLDDHREAAVRAGSELRFEDGGPLTGESDRRHLVQIVCSLLSNAIKFGAGSPLTVRLEGSSDWVSLQVTDQGIGIAAHDQERIFERFERAVDSRHYGGLGLGLWLARKSIEMLGGTLRVTSTPGEGATFSVLLPRRRVTAPVQPRDPLQPSV
ncbi:hypothetical protein FGE12_00215 [Aggregicoccus sp. 17bor-14]|uniref:ATP-binding protein n=1 Tax=Myxococcaceae TaxID=31 RepID=UPI00129D0A4B|nr:MULTISPECIES: ATP-binding protein [Myxococcaceae]MBF5040798.1 MASE1 domain-containing protein [Simulacricoccus sp. 17bor-14]MRI86586.1 hypothetical protein [Aggregicoccus sp. 17bor-14]